MNTENITIKNIDDTIRLCKQAREKSKCIRLSILNVLGTDDYYRSQLVPKCLEMEEQNEKLERKLRILKKTKEDLCNWTSATDKDKQRIDEQKRPNLYYNFKYNNYGCEIVKTRYGFDEEEQREHIYKDEKFAIRVYGNYSEVMKDYRLHYIHKGTNYGRIETLEEAKKLYNLCCLEIITKQMKSNLQWKMFIEEE